MVRAMPALSVGSLCSSWLSLSALALCIAVMQLFVKLMAAVFHAFPTECSTHAVMDGSWQQCAKRKQHMNMSALSCGGCPWMLQKSVALEPCVFHVTPSPPSVGYAR